MDHKSDAERRSWVEENLILFYPISFNFIIKFNKLIINYFFNRIGPEKSVINFNKLGSWRETCQAVWRPPGKLRQRQQCQRQGKRLLCWAESESELHLCFFPRLLSVPLMFQAGVGNSYLINTTTSAGSLHNKASLWFQAYCLFCSHPWT